MARKRTKEKKVEFGTCKCCGKTAYGKANDRSSWAGYCSLQCSYDDRPGSIEIKAKMECVQCLAKIGMGFKKTHKMLGFQSNTPSAMGGTLRRRGIKAATGTKAMKGANSWHEYRRQNQPNTSTNWGKPTDIIIAGYRKELRAFRDWGQHIECLRWSARRSAKQRWAREPKGSAYKVRSAVSTRMYHAIRRQLRGAKGHHKACGTEIALGCSMPEFMGHIESTWKHGMSWDNWGIGDGHWNIDHIVPCSHYDLTDPDQLSACFHWSNQQAMWAIPNIRKGNRVSATLTLNLGDAPCLVM